MSSVMRRALIFTFFLAGTFIVLRLSLYFSPNSNFDIGTYNIHHLFTGLLLMTLAIVPLILHNHQGRFQDFLIALLGIGLSMALDEWVYLIVTDGSDSSYLMPVSFWGGLIAISMTSIYTLVFACLVQKTDRNQ